MNQMELIKMVMLHSGNQYAQDKLTNYFSKWGISARSHSHVDLRNLTEVEAISIYKKDFWDFYKFTHIPPKVRAILMTTGVILGFGEAFKMLSQAVEYFPLKEAPTDELLAVIDAKDDEATRARMGTLLIFYLYDHNLLASNIRSLIPRILEAVSS